MIKVLKLCLLRNLFGLTCNLGLKITNSLFETVRLLIGMHP